MNISGKIVMGLGNQDHLERVPSFTAFLRLLKREMPIGIVTDDLLFMV